jgi:hypothetical protein
MNTRIENKDDGPEPPPDSQLYLKCMIQIRERLDTVLWLNSSMNFLHIAPFFASELIFVQFRKALELVAFASLTVNKEKYAAAHAKFASHWKADKMLRELEKVNANFYPLPVHLVGSEKEASERGRFHYEVVKDGYLTRDEFEKLFDASSEVLHTPNPFSEKDPAINVHYPIPMWVERIRQLIRLHSMALVDGRRWIVYVPDVGKVSVHSATPNPNVK